MKCLSVSGYGGDEKDALDQLAENCNKALEHKRVVKVTDVVMSGWRNPASGKTYPLATLLIFYEDNTEPLTEVRDA